MAHVSPSSSPHAAYSWHAADPPDLSDCPHPWDRIDVTRRGGVLACCFAQEPLGNLERQSLASILNGARRRRLQDDIANNRINPACLAAACIYAHRSARRPWSVHLPPDRFRVRGLRGSRSAFCPSRADGGVLVEGPNRFLPAGRIEARPRVVVMRPVSACRRPICVELVAADESGAVHASVRQPAAANGAVDIAAAFVVPPGERRRFSIRLGVEGFGALVIFRGLDLSGEPVP